MTSTRREWLASARDNTAQATTTAIQAVVKASPGGGGGILAGLQAAAFSYALVLIPVWVITTAAQHSTVTLAQASGVAARMWLTGFAVPWAIDDVPITLVPWGVGLITAAMITVLTRRFAGSSVLGALTATATFCAAVSIIAVLAWGGTERGDASATRALVVALVISGLSSGWAVLSDSDAVSRWWDRQSPHITVALRSAVALVLGTAAIAAAVLVLSGAARWREISAASTALGVDSVGGAAFALVETLYAPTLTVWVMAWLSGAGYGISDSLVTPTGGGVDLPSLPLLEAMPGQVTAGALMPLALVALGVIVAWALASQMPKRERWWWPGLVAGVALAAFAMAVAVRLTRGALGPGELQSIGAPVATSAILAGAWWALGVMTVVAVQVLRDVITARRTALAAPPVGKATAQAPQDTSAQRLE